MLWQPEALQSLGELYDFDSTPTYLAPWQDLQVAVSNEWLGFFGLLKLEVLVWHTSQEMPATGTWFEITPFAVLPLWQVEHVPAATPV